MAVYAGQYGPEGIEFSDGGHAANVLVTVLAGAVGLTAATLYDNRDRDTQLDNPIFTDGLGNLTFCAEPGRYRLVVGQHVIQVVVPEDPDEPDAELTEEQVGIIVENAADEVLGELEPQVNLTTWFENQLS